MTVNKIIKKKFLVEVCANSVMSALAAQKGGASRVELCDNLTEGGTTPSYGSIITARKYLSIALNVLIRPRGGDFLYNDAEFEIIRQDVISCREAGADGIVTGILKENGTIDQERMAEIVQLAWPMTVTFHRAFDKTADAMSSMEKLTKLGINRLLTSGHRETAIAGASEIAQLIKAAGENIIIMPGSGINEDNITRLFQLTDAREFHVSARHTRTSSMTYRDNNNRISSISANADYEISETQAERIKKIVETVSVFH